MIKSVNVIRFLVCAVGVYIFGFVLVFDLSSVATPTDEDNHNGRTVAIGPRPRSWVPWAYSDFDIPGDFGYSADKWPFQVWKPLCLVYLKIRGYERPAEWRSSSHDSPP